MSIIIKRTNSDNTDFQKLVYELETYLTGLDEEAHNECKEYNKLETINHVIIAYENNVIVGCGAIRGFDKDTIEIKRMFVSDKFRNKGIATRILFELEIWAKDQGYIKSILETGTMMLDSISFYQKNNYIQIPNYGQYSSKPKSICFFKPLK
jgi:putative acetyltransferase